MPRRRNNQTKKFAKLSQSQAKVEEALLVENIKEGLEYFSLMAEYLALEKQRIAHQAICSLLESASKTCEPGWHSRTEGSWAMYDPRDISEAMRKGETPVPLIETHTVMCCTRKCCQLEETTKKFKRCTNCYSKYCSEQCQRLDWPDHSKFCKSEKAFKSRLRHWRSHLPEDLSDEKLDSPMYELYLEGLKSWLNTTDTKQLLRFTGVNADDVLSKEAKIRKSHNPEHTNKTIPPEISNKSDSLQKANEEIAKTTATETTIRE